MQFCECGNLLKIKSDAEGKFLYCKSCDKKTPLKEDIKLKSVYENEGQEVVVVSEKEQSEFPVTDILCPKCEKVRECYWTMQQTRGGDEPPTRFYHCKTCNWRWREYS